MDTTVTVTVSDSITDTATDIISYLNSKLGTKYTINNKVTIKHIRARINEGYTIEDFCMEHPQGTYVIGTGSHAVAVVDGILFDSWNSLGEIAIYFYKKGE